MKTKFYTISSKDVEIGLINLSQITFEVTSFCNLNCLYCCYGELYQEGTDRPLLNMSFSKAQKCLDYLFELWDKNKKYISLSSKVYVSFYGGEPLLNIELIKKVIEYVKLKNERIQRNVVYSLTTNAVLLGRYMDFLVENDIEILVSLDGDEYSNSYRTLSNGLPSFGKIYENLKRLKETHRDYFEKRVLFNTVLHNRNSIGDINDFFENEFSKKTNISELNRVGLKEDKKDEFERIYMNYGKDLYLNRDVNEETANPDEDSAKLFLECYSGNYYENYNHLFLDKFSLPVSQTGTCFPFSKKMFVTVEGKILPCERIPQKYTFAEVTDDELFLDCSYVADKHNELLERIKNKCMTCNAVRHCQRCIYQFTDEELSSGKCMEYMDKNDFRKFVNRNLFFLYKKPSLYLNM